MDVPTIVRTAVLSLLMLGIGFAQPDDPELQGVLLQTYFISVDNFSAPVMMGGMGVTFMPPMEMMQMMAERAGLPMEQMPQNPGLLLAIYASGEPRLVPGVMPDMGPPADFGTMRWDPEGFDTTIYAADQAMLMMKFTEWAKYFHRAWDGEALLFPAPMERLLSNLFIAEPMMMAQFIGANLMTEQGLVHAINMDGGERTVIDDAIVASDQAYMLWALSDFVLTMRQTMDLYPNLVMPEMMMQMMMPDGDPMAMMSGMMNRMFRVVQSNPVGDVEHRGLTTVALTWYAAATDDPQLRQSALTLINAYASTLGRDEGTAFEMAGSIRGLLEAARVTGNTMYRDQALALWGELDALWDEAASAYAPVEGATTYTYTPWGIGLLVGAMAEMIAGTDDPALQRAATDRYVALFSNVIQAGATHTQVPSPGSTGIFYAEIEYDTGTGSWSVTDGRYSSGGSQYAANEMIWLEGTLNGRIDGYPDVP